MATVSYEQFLPEVLPEVPGCTDMLAVKAIRNACIEFCELSLLLQRDHDPVSVSALVGDYDFEPPTGTLVTKVMSAWFRGSKLQTAVPDRVDVASIFNPLYSGAEVSKGTPTHLIQKDERTFTVWPVPETAEAQAITMRVALKPTRGSTTVEDVLYEDWAEVIAYGAKARLMAVSTYPFSNPEMASNQYVLFRQGITKAKSRALKGHGRGSLRVRFVKI